MQVFRQTLQDPIDLRGKVFMEPVTFTDVTFVARANFMGAVFQQGASFFGCTFQDGADFSWTRFFGKAYFWRAHFLGPTTFRQMAVKPADQPQDDFLYPGEANFSWAFFTHEADFFRAHFHGPAYFWRTVFRESTNYGQTGFEVDAHFEGTQHAICIARRDFADRELFDVMLSKGLITLDEETVGFHDYAHFPNVTSLEGLRAHLADLGDPRIGEVELVWKKYAHKMFPEGQDTLFTNAYFRAPGNVNFMHVNLDRCIFSGSNVGMANLVDVQWDCRREFLSFYQRRALHDEHYVRHNRDYTFIAKIYHELRKNHESLGRYDEAGDFYYGEMEMKRMAQPLLLQYVSIIAAYRYLSGYGEQYVLALFWLIALLFAVFPVLYIAANISNDLAEAIVHSLEVSTFLEKNTTGTVLILGRLVEGFQRIVVPVQAGLVLLAIKQKFERK